MLPARNEEAYLPRTLASAHAAARALDVPYEVIVADDGSTDRTAAIAREAGARVVSVSVRQIAAARNAGAAAAVGARLVFLDADTILPAETLRAAWRALDEGAVGGGARVAIDGASRRPLRAATAFWNAISMTMRWAAGSFLYACAEDFRAVGGFDERYYAAEEIFLSRALARRGRFKILGEPVFTSPRKEALGPAVAARTFLRIFLTGGRALRRREGLDLWY